MSIWIVIPCYQGEKRVGEVVRGAKRTGLPVAVIDDGSTDRSGAAAIDAGADKLLRHPLNFGKGAALATGFAFARSEGAEAVLTLDADGQHDPTEIAQLIAAHRARPDAVVIGVRSFQREEMPRRSRVGNRISTWWISKFAGRNHQDTQSGFRIYPRALYERIQLRSTRFDTETELLLWSAKLGLPLVEVPVRTIYEEDRVTHFRGFVDTMRVIRLVIGSPLWPVSIEGGKPPSRGKAA